MTTEPKLPAKIIISSPITLASHRETLARVIAMAKQHLAEYICVSSVHQNVEAYLEADFNQVVKNAAIVTADGKPLSVFMNLIYGTKQERVAGMDILPELIGIAARENLSMCFLGSTPEILQIVETKTITENPGARLMTYSPPFKPMTDAEVDEICEKINAFGAHIVFVALGCPKQERWMARTQHKINATQIGIGAALLTYAGTLSRAPKWMQDYSLEWVYRLYQHPKWLFWRYLKTNTLFLILVTAQLLYWKLFKKQLFA